MWRHVVRFGLLVVWVSACVAAPPSGGVPFSEETIERALETGCSLVVAEILSVRDEGGMHYYRSRIARTIVAGDLEKEEVRRPLDLFAGASYADALKPGSHYALFVARDYPHQFSWAFRDDIADVNLSDERGIRRLIAVADRVYAGTSMRRFRRARAWQISERPPLPEGLGRLCEEFRNKPGQRTQIARQIAESDLGSRIDASRPESSVRTFLPPKISCSRRQMISLLGYPSWMSGWTYSWRCDHRVSRTAGGGEIGVLSVTFDPNERATHVLYGMHERSKWIRPTRSADYLAAADGDPADVARAFQRALRESNWQQALSSCSQQVKAKARAFDSAEAFFRGFVPIEEIIALPGFGPREFSSRDGETVRMSARVAIDVPDAERPVQWSWTLVRAEQTWVIDFEVTTLETFIRKELLRREFMERRPRIPPDEFARAIEFRLIPVVGEFVLGQPMPFRIEMRNSADTPIPYMRSPSVMTNDPMLVTGPDGRSVPYADVSYQIGVGMDVILPGETIVLADRYDITSQYRIVQEGRYRFQFRGWPRESERSNTCEVDVKPGVLSDVDRISQSLLSVLPAGWDLERRPSSPPDGGEEAGAGWLSISLIGRHAGKGGDKGVFLLILSGREPADTDPWLKEQYDFWGRSHWGLVYARVNEAASLWPDYKADIVRSLAIQPPQRP